VTVRGYAVTKPAAPAPYTTATLPGHLVDIVERALEGGYYGSLPSRWFNASCGTIEDVALAERASAITSTLLGVAVDLTAFSTREFGERSLEGDERRLFFAFDDAADRWERR
jgi:hypothetical protein